MYTDSIDQPIAPGDWVVYSKSGYARIAKILDIAPTGRTMYNNHTEHKMTVMTAADDKTFRRTFNFVPWRTQYKTYSVIRIDRPPAREEKMVEDRLARTK